jgi:hypothetical protein
LHHQWGWGQAGEAVEDQHRVSIASHGISKEKMKLQDSYEHWNVVPDCPQRKLVLVPSLSSCNVWSCLALLKVRPCPPDFMSHSLLCDHFQGVLPNTFWT